MNIHLQLAPLAFLVLTPGALSQTCPIAIDINVTGTPISSSPGDLKFGVDQPSGPFTSLAGQYYFPASTTAKGIELFATDGTATGAHMVADINMLGGSGPSNITATNTQVFFIATDGQAESQLRVVDNSPLGFTTIVGVGAALDHSTGPIGAFGGKVLFKGFATDGSHAVWVSDGTDLGTFPVTGTTPLTLFTEPADFHASPSGSQAFFTAANSFFGRELFITDGTVAGTTRLILNPGMGDSAPQNLVTFNGLVYFTAKTGATGRELWVSDGTKAGTHTFVDINPGDYSSFPMATGSAEFGGELYFSANDDSAGYEVWKTDGTAIGTVQVTDINPGSGGSYPTDFAVSGGVLFINATDGFPSGSLHGRELYKIDLAGQVQLVKDITAGPADSTGTSTDFGDSGSLFTAVGNQLVFLADDGINGREPWVSDGTAAGTFMLKDIAPGAPESMARRFTVIGPSTVIFAAEDDTHGRELWISDLTPQGTQLLQDIDDQVLSDDSSPQRLSSPNGTDLLFFANQGSKGPGLFKYNAAAGLTKLAQVQTGFYNYDLLNTFWLGDRQLTFFAGRSPGFDIEPWVTDLTDNGTFQLVDLSGGPGHSFPEQFTQLGDKVLFVADRFSTGKELFITDGTTPGTKLLKDINQDLHPVFGANEGSDLKDFVELNGRVYFAATDGKNALGHELWSTDGTASGTKILVDINPGTANSFPSNMFKFKGNLYFSAYTPATHYGLWISNGQPNGTSLLQSAAAMQAYLPNGFFKFQDTLYFFASDQATNLQVLFKSDGTAMGTVRASADGIGTDVLMDGLEVDGIMYFAHFGQGSGLELWRSDGTQTGTYIVKDINPGPDSAKPVQFVPANGGLYFLAINSGLTHSLWFTDGTDIGTHMVCVPIAVGASSSFAPSQLTMADGMLMFTATGPYAGREVFQLTAPGAYVADLGPDIGNPVLTANAPQLGGALNVACEQIPENSVSVLAISAPASAPSNYLTSYGSASWIDPTSASVLGAFLGTAWTWSTQVPLTPTLVGLRLNMQVYALLGASFPAVTSNGLSMLVGN